MSEGARQLVPRYVGWEEMTKTCRICGRPSTRLVGLTGFCRRHKAEADAMAKTARLHGGVERWDIVAARYEAVRNKRDAVTLNHGVRRGEGNTPRKRALTGWD